MKLESVSIRDFRSIKRLDLSFKDDLDLIRDCFPIVGPNTSGKTTILDAITLSLMPMADAYQLREGFRWSPTALVRSGAARASVSSTVWFSDDEIEATKEVLARSEVKGHGPVPSEGRVTVHWTYPDPGPFQWGNYSWEPPDGWIMSVARKYLAGYLHVPGLGPKLFQRLGGIFMFDVQRRSLWKRLSAVERIQLGQLLDPEQQTGDSGGNGNAPVDIGSGRLSEQAEHAYTKDPRLILTSLAMRAQVAQDPKATEREDFARLKQIYEHVCHPHTIGELYNTEHGLDMEFRSDQGRYYYDGLSGGQQVILQMLLQFATRRIHRSIVLIDELDLHLHPLWQDRLYGALPGLGEDNQYIFTTHSTHLRDTIGEQFYHATGEITDHAVTS
jgi:hypothetical protein